MSTLDRARLDPKSAAPLMRRASYASVAVASVLIVAKLIVGLITGSVAILSSLMDSVLDLVASIIDLVAIRQAVQPADMAHRFGHGKAEAVAGLLQAAAIFAAAAFVVFQAATRMIDPQPIAQTEMGIAVMAGSILLTALLVLYQRSVVKRTGSLAVSADSLHYAGDLLTNLAVIAALVLAGFFDLHWADPVFAVGVATYLGWNAWQILMQALDVLMDRELPEEERAEIEKVILAHDGVISVHDLRTRSAGQTVFLQFHIDLPQAISLREAHNISDDVEDTLYEHYPGAEIIIHADPLGVMERRDHFDDEEEQ